jgi:hypothetical protein
MGPRCFKFKAKLRIKQKQTQEAKNKITLLPVKQA